MKFKAGDLPLGDDLNVINTYLNCYVTNSMEHRPFWEVNSQWRNFAPFMESEGSLPCSQDRATSPYPEQDASSPHLRTLYPKDRI